MFIGQIIMSGQDAYTPWMQRGGDSGKFTYQFISSGGGVPYGTSPSDQVTFEVYTKNSDDQGDGSMVGSGVSLGSAGFGTEEITGSSGLKEMVRFKISSLVVTVQVGGDDWDIARWIYFRILAPIWYNKA